MMPDDLCIKQINGGCGRRFFSRIEAKRMIIFGPKVEQSRVSTQLRLIQPETTVYAGNLCVVMDSDLNCQKHVNTTSKLAFYHLNKISRIKRLMSQQDHLHVFIFKGIDYLNIVSTGLSKKSGSCSWTRTLLLTSSLEPGKCSTSPWF